MFAGAQIVTTKLVHPDKQRELIDNQNEDKTAQDLVNMSILVPRSKAAIVAENQEEKIQRKALVQERKRERITEQQKLAQYMEDLMEKVLRERSLSKKDEENLRNKMKTIMNKVNKESDQIDGTSRIKLDSIKQSDQRAFLLWYDQNFK